MSVQPSENTPFLDPKQIKICSKYGKRYLLDNYNNDETPTFHWFVGVLLSLASQDRSSRNFAFSR